MRCATSDRARSSCAIGPVQCIETPDRTPGTADALTESNERQLSATTPEVGAGGESYRLEREGSNVQSPHRSEDAHDGPRPELDEHRLGSQFSEAAEQSEHRSRESRRL